MSIQKKWYLPSIKVNFYLCAKMHDFHLYFCVYTATGIQNYTHTKANDDSRP